jgi:2-polyprenyl-3-methyl-5-hydroxy-6-metoxy-1,4-benzoquinol methylase
MYNELSLLNSRPEPFQYCTADKLWTDNHTSKKMLEFHLDETIDVSSRNKAFIDRSVEWITRKFQVKDNYAIADFGCGPGLYTTPLAERGADITGIDFSERSIRYAKQIAQQKKLNIDYVIKNYLEYDTEKKYDLIIMIMCDFCALGPAQRKQMLQKFHVLLKPKGSVLLDVYSLHAYEKRKETVLFEHNLLNGFFSPEDYYGFLNTFKYEKEKVVLDKYTIVEASQTKTIYNWLQYFNLEAITKEFSENGLGLDECYSDVAGTPFRIDADEFAVVAHTAESNQKCRTI